MVESPELIVNANVGQAIAGRRIFFAALQHGYNYRTDSPNVKQFCALQQFRLWQFKSAAYDCLQAPCDKAVLLCGSGLFA